MRCWYLGGPGHDTDSRPSGPVSLRLTGHPGKWLSAEVKQYNHIYHVPIRQYGRVSDGKEELHRVSSHCTRLELS